MEQEIKVSVIIPVYQVENFLERAIDSVLEQTLQELEIILVDDGSEDASPEICDAYAAAFPDKIHVIHKENEGLGFARNTGVAAARGAFVAFLDSDDTVEPEMYETLYQKAVSGNYDIVMCDVNIIYVEAEKTSVVTTYAAEQIDLADYIANGNNITYSVNKLYRRFIWQENQYEKMLFEDIALIPALITRYPNIGYVQRPFYNYFRRANTISTSFVGGMIDITDAFRRFLDHSDPLYREEVVYCAAKQIYWNMTQSRTLFQADFIELLREYAPDFRLNPLIRNDAKIKKLLEYMERDVIPDQLICIRSGGTLPQAYLDTIGANFPHTGLLLPDQTLFDAQTLPECVRQAIRQGRSDFAEEYFALRLLFEQGGIVLRTDMRPKLELKKLRMLPIFFGFAGEDALTGGCFGALPHHYVIQGILDTYRTDSVFNKAFLPLNERIMDFLVLHFDLKVNGKKQLLQREVQVFLPSVLAFDMQDGENCCKQVFDALPEQFQMVSDNVLKMWSDQLLTNWNLYKQEKNSKSPAPAGRNAPQKPVLSPDVFQLELEERIQEVVENYEHSTSWRLTKPIRALGRLFKREGKD